MAAYAEAVVAPFLGMETEAVAFRTNPDKPSRYEIRDKDYVLMTAADAATFGPRWLLRIDGWENMVGCTIPGYATPKRRTTSTVMFLRVIHNEPVPFKITAASLQAKQLV